ncbi:hypothetical protein FSARC_11745 [Fusarium sarcochroum]|uniref:Uncharacterized protein n=1 Tax=Fusarium sarcochroum TaxID=1208366 RepID=A0A8H4TDD4_9HYPO|nr:hypothetical protein FSARC_11745 [Fusarium sarcochroum]
MDNSLARSHSLKPPRRKLQKQDPKLKSLNKAKRGSLDSPASLSPQSTMSSPSQRRISNGAPDLSDAKWSHYLRPKTIIEPSFSEPELEYQQPEPRIEPTYQPEPMYETEPERRAFFSPPPLQRHSSQRTIPEFNHLNIYERSARPSLDSSSIPSTASSASTSSIMRRQAKTPVFRIGQLEQHALARKARDAPEKTSSVELIADQYRAILESKDGPPPLKSHLPYDEDRELNRRTTLQVPPQVPKRSNSRRTNSYTTASPQPSRPKLRPSATHDTNVAAFEGDTIYFKPYSFSPPISPDETPGNSPQNYNDTFRPQSSSGQSFQDNVSLQIALDLLTRELAAAVALRSRHNRQDTAALQIWVMIEAYEKLRDQLTRSQNEEAEKVALIFDCWLASLYSIHSSLTGGDLPSPTEYAGLEEDLD